MSRLGLSAVVLMSAALVVGTAACGGSITGSGSPAPVTTSAAPAPLRASDVVSAIKNASAVHVKGTMADSGSSIGLDLQINKDGTASGTMAIDGPSYPITYVNKVVYIQFTPDVIKASGIDASSSAGKLLMNKWVPSTSQILSQTNLASSVRPLLDYTQFVTQITKNVPTGPLKRGASDVVDGTPVTRYTFSDGTPADIATASPHYLIRLLPGPKDGAGEGEMDFSGWNAPVPVTAPSSSEIFTG